MNLLSFNNISKVYGKTVALKNVNLSFNEYCIVGLVGPNGAGKTTLFRLVMNLINPSSGSIEIMNQKIRSDTIGHYISYCSDGDNLYDDLTVGENLEFIVRAYGTPAGNRKIKELSSLMSIDKEFNTPVKNLSKGMRKKVAIIRTLINQTPIIIMDEPMSWLDIDNQKQLAALLKKLSQTSLIIISSHNIYQIEKMCKKIVILNQEIKFFDDIKNIDYGNLMKIKIEFEKGSYRSGLKEELNKVEGVIEVQIENETLTIEYDRRYSNVERKIIPLVIQKYELRISKINYIEKGLEDLYFDRVR